MQRSVAVVGGGVGGLRRGDGAGTGRLAGGMVGLLGAKIWVQNRVDLGRPATLSPLAAGLIISIGG